MHVPVRLSIPMRGTSIFQSRRQRIQPAIHGGEHLRGKSISQNTHTQKKEQEVDGNKQQQISKEKDQYIARSTARVQKRSIETVTAAACARMFFCVGRNRSFSSAPRKRGSKRAGVKDPIVTAQRGPTLFRLFSFSSCFF